MGADKAYDVADFVTALRARSVSPHIAIDGHVRVTGKPRKTSVDRRVTRHAGYAVSQRCRKRIEEVFGWIKGAAGLAKVKLRGTSPGRHGLHPGLGRLQSDPSAQTVDGAGMSVQGRWLVVETPGYDMAVPAAYILLDQDGGCLENGDDIPFSARRSTTSSTAC